MSKTCKLSINREAGTVLVLGASGYIGSHLVPALVKNGYVVRAVCRDIDSLTVRRWQGVELVNCDLLDKKSIEGVLEGVTFVYYLVHSMANGKGYAERDYRAAINFANAASTYNIKHIIYLGSLSSEATHSTHLLSREQTGIALKSFELPVTEFRAPIIIGPGSVPFEVIRDVVNQLPAMILPTQMTSRSAPIALDNLLHYLIEALQLDTFKGQTIDICGPEIVSYIQLMKRYGKTTKTRFHSLITSLIPLWIMRFAIPIFSPAPSEITKALLGGVSHDIEASPQQIRDVIPQNLLSIEQAIQATERYEYAQQDSLDWYHGSMIYRHHNNRNSFYGERIIVNHSLNVTPEYIWKILATIGGSNGYFYLDILWRIRGWIDAAIGGPGFIRYRDNVHELYSGDKIDTWIIMEAKKHERLLMKFIMRSPGAGCLEFKIEQQTPDKTELKIIAYMHPRGIWGRLYWLAFKPAHLLIFHGMAKKILRLAKKVQNLETH